MYCRTPRRPAFEKKGEVDLAGVVPYVHKLTSYCSGSVVLVLLGVLSVCSGVRAQSVREPIGVSPFATESVNPPSIDRTPRPIDPIVMHALPQRQMPQAVPKPRYKTSGKEFYLVFLSSVSSDPGSTVLRRIYISSRAHVRVKISHVGGTWSQTIEVLPRSLTPVTLPLWASLDRFEMEAAFKRVFKVEAEDDVAVYALSPNYLSSDGFLVLPKESLGKEYVVSSVRNALYYGIGALGPLMGGEPFPRSEFGVAAIEDGTEVTIRLTANSYSRRYLKDTYYKFTLRQGEVIQFMARDTGRKDWVNYWDNVNQVFVPRISWVGKELDGTDCDLTGSQVLSNKPVAVFSGHERASVPDQLEFSWEDHPDVSRDHIIEQIPPVEHWGKRFIVIASMQDWKGSRPPGGDVVRVLAHTDGTVVYLNGAYLDTLNTGEYTQFMSGEFACIETSEPALVVKYLSTADPMTDPGMGDPDMTVVPPVENMSTFYTLPTIYLGDYFTEHFITLIIDSAAINSTMLNGLPISSSLFKALPDLPYMYARLRTEYQGEQRVESSLPCYAETYGYGEVDSYSFSGGGDFHYIRGLTANNLNFGFVKLGDERDSMTTVLSTIAPSPLADTITVFRYTWDSGDTSIFAILDTITTPIKVAPGETLPVSFSFKPKVSGSYTARLRVWSNNFSSVYITVLGSAGLSYLKVEHSNVDYGRVRVNTPAVKSFFALIEGDNATQRIRIAKTDFDVQVAPYFITQPLANPTMGPLGDPTASFTRQVTFIPDSNGYFNAQIDLANDGAPGMDTQYVYLHGRGVMPIVATVDTNFGRVRYENSSPWYQMPVVNIGSDFTSIASVEILPGADKADFQLRAIPQPSVVLDTLGSPQNIQYYEAQFTPHYRSPNLVQNDVRSCTVMIVTIDQDTLYARLEGTAVEPWFEASPLTLDFGTVRNPLLTDPGTITKKFAIRNIGTMKGLLDALTIPTHDPGDSVYFTVEVKPPQMSFDRNVEDSAEVIFYIKNVGVFRDSIMVENDSRTKPLVYLMASVEAEYDLNDSIYADTVSDCLPIDTIIRVRNPYRIPIFITDTLFSGNPGGFTFFPDIRIDTAPIIIAPGEYFDFTVRYEFPIDSVNGEQIFDLIITKPVVSGGIQSLDQDTVRIVLFRKMQLLDLVAGKLPYNPNAKDAPFRLPINIKGTRFGKSELDNMTVRLHFSNLLVAPVGIDRTGSLTESTAANGVPPQPNWTWDEDTRIMTIPVKDAVISTDPTKNTLLFTLLGTTYLTLDTMVEITPEIAYDNKPCAYRISRDSTTVIYANECGDRTIRDMLLNNKGFSIGHPYPDPSSSTDATEVKIPYMTLHDVGAQWRVYNELGEVCFTSNEEPLSKGIGMITIGKHLVRTSGLYLFEIVVRNGDGGVDKITTKFVVAD